MHFRVIWIFAIVGVLNACGGGGGGGDPQAGSSDVSVTATGPTALVPSVSTTEFEFLVTNSGTSAAIDVVLTVALGSGLTKGAVVCSSLLGATCPSNSGSLSVAILPAGGSLRFRMSVVVAAGARGTIVSTASVAAANDQVTSNNSSQMSIAAYSAEVSVIGSTNANDYFSGSDVSYSFTVSNTGPDAARNVIIENSPSARQSITGTTCTASGGATCPITGANMHIPSLPSGGSLTFVVTGQLAMDAVVSASNTMRATAFGDSNSTNDAATVSTLTRIPTSPDSPSFVMLQSDGGDQIGIGRSYSYTNANAAFELIATGGILSVKVRGNEDWDATFYMPASMAELRSGTYVDAIGAPAHDPSTGGMDWRGEGRACYPHTDWFKVDNVVYAAGAIASVDIRFEQHCGGVVSGLRGQIHWVAGDATRPPGPINPPPVGLWQPAAGATPANGNYIYTKSDFGDYIGGGRTEIYTQSNATLSATVDASGRLVIGMIGNRTYGASFRPMLPLNQLAPGYYPDVQHFTFGNPTLSGFNFSGDGRACGSVIGWFIIDSITFSNDEVTAIDARFEQHCDGNPAALRGKIHWRTDDPTEPSGPQDPPPPGLWAPPSGAVPATGNFVYLQSDINDFIGLGQTKLYTPLDSVIDVGGGGMTPVGNRFQLAIRGDTEWTGYFQAMSTLPDLRAGYYGDLLGFPSHNPVKGGIDWSGGGRGCNDASGWFVIDSVTYTGNTLTSIELRFEQHCEYSGSALRGMIRWSASDTRNPLPPQVPPPTDLWTPAAGATPATGNYVYLQSDSGDFIGAGQTHLYTSLDALLLVDTLGSTVNLEVQGDLYWRSFFIPMAPLPQLQVGYYGGIVGSSIAKGRFNWSGDGRGCNTITGWFVVDDVAYTAGSLTSIDLRFEQHCAGATASLRGKIHWRFDDPTMPPGPQQPAPPSLWTPPAGATPANGNFFYTQSDPGDYIGLGRTLLLTSSNARFEDRTFPNQFIVGAQNDTEMWTANFDRMSSIPRLQPGYYPNVQLLRRNPTVGNMTVSGNGHSCNSLTGWFVIESVTYTGTDVTAIDVRFEQRCNGTNAALRGRIRWSR